MVSDVEKIWLASAYPPPFVCPYSSFDKVDAIYLFMEDARNPGLQRAVMFLNKQSDFFLKNVVCMLAVVTVMNSLKAPPMAGS